MKRSKFCISVSFDEINRSLYGAVGLVCVIVGVHDVRWGEMEVSEERGGDEE